MGLSKGTARDASNRWHLDRWVRRSVASLVYVVQQEELVGSGRARGEGRKGSLLAGGRSGYATGIQKSQRRRRQMSAMRQTNPGVGTIIRDLGVWNSVQRGSGAVLHLILQASLQWRRLPSNTGPFWGGGESQK
ncbi:unnamed protein product [Arctogadus glacialis]